MVFVLVKIGDEVLSSSLSQTAHKVELEDDSIVITLVLQAIDNSLEVVLA